MITYHPLGENTLLRFLLIATTGAGLTGQAPEVLIKRRSDGEYWNGATFQVLPILLVMTEEDAVNLPGSYFYAFNQATAGGSPAEYLVRYINPVPAPNNALDEEQHVYQTQSPFVNPQITIGHALSDDGSTLTVIAWVEVGGLRVTSWNSMAAQIKDNQGNVVQDLGTTTEQTTDGVFTFSCPVAAVQRNAPYIVAIQAVQGITTSSVNEGFVRV
jgi:hypothetical protein